MSERIKELRKALGLTQQEFADRIGSVQNTITGYETGRRAPSNQVITLICREFNVNDHWLRTGEGEMFMERSTDERIAEFVGSALSGRGKDIQRRMLAALSKLRDEDWDAVDYFVQALLEESEARKQTETEQDLGGR